MDNIWFTEDVLATDVPVWFGSFRCAPAQSNQVQPNDYDCGVFVIRNMQMYERNWALEVISFTTLLSVWYFNLECTNVCRCLKVVFLVQYVSDQQRASLALECMWHPNNEFPPLDTSVTECLGRRRECGVQSWFEKLSEFKLADRYGGRGTRAADGNGAVGLNG